MADTKISALTAATTPLAGTEVLPIVQSGVTKQVSVANLTAGRAVSADSLTLTGSPLPATSGGTGQSSYAVGDLLYASTTTALSKLADVATGNALISGGVGVAPSWGKIGLTTHISGTLGTGNGGTGLTSFTSTGILYASSGSVLATGSDFTYNNGTLTINQSLALLRMTSSTGTNTVNAGFTNTGGSFYIGLDSSTGGNFGAGNYGALLYNGANSPLVIFTNATKQFSFDTSGNLVPANAAKGINFTANTGAAGKTSQLLNWYEEGTWTPTLTTDGTDFTSVTYDPLTTGKYTRIGRVVYINGNIRTDAVTVGSASGNVQIGGLPFSAVAPQGCFAFSQAEAWATNQPSSGETTGTKIYLFYRATANGVTTLVPVSNVATGANSNLVFFSGFYFV